MYIRINSHRYNKYKEATTKRMTHKYKRAKRRSGLTNSNVKSLHYTRFLQNADVDLAQTTKTTRTKQISLSKMLQYFGKMVYSWKRQHFPENCDILDNRIEITRAIYNMNTDYI